MKTVEDGVKIMTEKSNGESEVIGLNQQRDLGKINSQGQLISQV